MKLLALARKGSLLLMLLPSLMPVSGLVAIKVPLRNVPAGPGQVHGSRERRSAEEETMDMKDNLRGKSGQGYYVEMRVGTPPQTVGGHLLNSSFLYI